MAKIAYPHSRRSNLQRQAMGAVQPVLDIRGDLLLHQLLYYPVRVAVFT